MVEIFPSLISSDLLNLQKEIEILDSHCHGYHIDVMDDHFVPNLTWGTQFVEAIDKATAKPLWVHLMVDDPRRWVKILSLNANSIISFHIESSKETRTILDLIKKKNIVPSIAINPKTPIETIFPFLDILPHVLVMSVEPGFSGQSFLPEVVQKVDLLRGYCQSRGFKCKIGMDGGIGKENISMLCKKGVEHFGIGSAIFEEKDRVGAINNLYKVSSS